METCAVHFVRGHKRCIFLIKTGARFIPQNIQSYNFGMFCISGICLVYFGGPENVVLVKVNSHSVPFPLIIYLN